MIRTAAVFFLLAIFFCAYSLPAFVDAQEVQEAREEASPQANAQEKIVPSPQSVKEATGIYVFVGWMWLAILVLIYVFRLKIKEADRLHQIQYFSSRKD